MGSVPATEFKAKCLRLMDRVLERRETYVITKRGRPVAKLVPVDPPRQKGLLGCLRETAQIAGDVESPLFPPAAWDAAGQPKSQRCRSPRRGHRQARR